MVHITVKCPQCGSDHIIKHGKDPKGVQKYRCKGCGYQFRLHPKSREHPPALVKQVLRAHQNRMSLRAIYRTFGVAQRRSSNGLKKSPEFAEAGVHSACPPV